MSILVSLWVNESKSETCSNEYEWIKRQYLYQSGWMSHLSLFVSLYWSESFNGICICIREWIMANYLYHEWKMNHSSILVSFWKKWVTHNDLYHWTLANQTLQAVSRRTNESWLETCAFRGKWVKMNYMYLGNKTNHYYLFVSIPESDSKLIIRIQIQKRIKK